MKKKILLTGGAGFVGSHLGDRLAKENYEVFAVDNLSKGDINNLTKKVNFFKLDINSSEFKKLLIKIKPHVIFHLAAQTSVNVSLKNPRHDLETNLISTLKLLESVQPLKVEKIIFASSAAIFGHTKKLPIQEADPKQPISFYGVSKLCSEYLLKNNYQRYKIPYISLRLANVYGPRQDSSGEGGVVAIFSGQIIKRQPITVYGNGNQTRDFIYVADVVEAFCLALKTEIVGEFNIGTSKETSVNDLVKTFRNITTRDISKVFNPARFIEVARNSLNYHKFKKVTGYQPRVDLREGLKKTIAYLAAN